MEHSTPQPRSSTLEALKKLARDLQARQAGKEPMPNFTSTYPIPALGTC